MKLTFNPFWDASNENVVLCPVSELKLSIPFGMLLQEGVEEYIKRLPDRRTAWLTMTARLAHRIDYEYTRYGVTETNWDEEL